MGSPDMCLRFFDISVLFLSMILTVPSWSTEPHNWDKVCRAAINRRVVETRTFEDVLNSYLSFTNQAAPDPRKPYAIDRLTAHPSLQKLNGIGIVAKQPWFAMNRGADGSDDTKMDMIQRMGSGFLISRCYVLTAFHVVENIAGGDKDTRRVKQGDDVYFHVGQGSTCRGNAAFDYRLAGTVADLGSWETDEDWAVVKLNQPAPARIPHLRIGAAKGVRPNDIVVGLGYSQLQAGRDWVYYNLNGFISQVDFVYSQKEQINVKDDVPPIVINGKKIDLTSRHGMSGGPLLWRNTEEKRTDENALIAVGLMEGNSGGSSSSYVSIANVIRELKRREDKLKVANPDAISTFTKMKQGPGQAAFCD